MTLAREAYKHGTGEALWEALGDSVGASDDDGLGADFHRAALDVDPYHVQITPQREQTCQRCPESGGKVFNDHSFLVIIKVPPLRRILEIVRALAFGASKCRLA